MCSGNRIDAAQVSRHKELQRELCDLTAAEEQLDELIAKCNLQLRLLTEEPQNKKYPFDRVRCPKHFTNQQQCWSTSADSPDVVLMVSLAAPLEPNGTFCSLVQQIYSPNIIFWGPVHSWHMFGGQIGYQCAQKSCTVNVMSLTKWKI